MLTSLERAALLRFARDTIAAHLTGSAPPPPVPLADPQAHSGAFVTLHAHRDLRGCIGYPGSEKRLDDVVGLCAIAAATEDPRFSALTASELPEVEIEISVLTPISAVRDVGEIEVGRDGLVVRDGFRHVPQLKDIRRSVVRAHDCSHGSPLRAFAVVRISLVWRMLSRFCTVQ